jgi:hypothetical protein
MAEAKGGYKRIFGDLYIDHPLAMRVRDSNENPFMELAE